MNTNNLQIVDSYEDDDEKIYYITRIDEKMSWPANWAIALFAMNSESKDKTTKMKKYRSLSIGDDKTKVVAIRK